MAMSPLVIGAWSSASANAAEPETSPIPAVIAPAATMPFFKNDRRLLRLPSTAPSFFIFLSPFLKIKTKGRVVRSHCEFLRPARHCREHASPFQPADLRRVKKREQFLLLRGAQLAEAAGDLVAFTFVSVDCVFEGQRLEVVHVAWSHAQTPQCGSASLFAVSCGEFCMTPSLVPASCSKKSL